MLVSSFINKTNNYYLINKKEDNIFHLYWKILPGKKQNKKKYNRNLFLGDKGDETIQKTDYKKFNKNNDSNINKNKTKAETETELNINTPPNIKKTNINLNMNKKINSFSHLTLNENNRKFFSPPNFSQTRYKKFIETFFNNGISNDSIQKANKSPINKRIKNRYKIFINNSTSIKYNYYPDKFPLLLKDFHISNLINKGKTESKPKNKSMLSSLKRINNLTLNLKQNKEEPLSKNFRNINKLFMYFLNNNSRPNFIRKKNNQIKENYKESNIFGKTFYSVAKVNNYNINFGTASNKNRKNKRRLMSVSNLKLSNHK